MRINLPDGTALNAPDEASPEQVQTIVKNFSKQRASDDNLRSIVTAAKTAGAPDQRAQALDVGKRLDLPPDVVQTRLPEFKAMAEASEFDPQKFREQNPALTEMVLKNPASAPVVVNDPKLFSLEWLMRGGPFRGITQTGEAISAKWQSEKLTGELSALAAKQYAGTMTPEESKRADALEAQMATIKHPDQGLLAGVPAETAGMLAGMKRNASVIAGYGGSGAIFGATAGLVGGPVGVAAGAATGLSLGIATGFGATTYADERPLFYRQAVREGADPAAAKVGAEVVGLASGVLAGLPIESVLKVVPGAKAILEGPTKAVMQAALKNPALKDTFLRAAVQMQKGQALMAITGALQDIVHVYGLAEVKGESGPAAVSAELAKGLASSPAQAATKMWQAAGGMHVISPGVWISTGTEALAARSATQRAEFLKSAGETVADSSTFQQLPDLAKTFVEDLQKRHGVVDQVEVPAGKLEAVLKGLDVEKTLPEVAKQLASATHPDEEVTIKTSDLFTHVAGRPGFETLIDDVRMGDAPTAREAKTLPERAKQIRAEMDAGPGEPPVQPGFVRLYHGGAEGIEGPKWLSADRKYAEGYAAKSQGAVVQYVDLPESSPLLVKSFDDSGTSMKAPISNFEAPAEVAKNLRAVRSGEPSEFDLAKDHSLNLAPFPREDMTEGEYKRYLDTFAPAVLEARQRADRATAREWQRAVSDDAYTLRKDFQAQAETDPVFDLRRTLLEGKDAAGEKKSIIPGTAWMESNKLDRSWLKENVDEGFQPEVAHFFKDGGIDPELVAPFYGYKTGQEMIWALAEKGNPKEWVRRQVNKALAEKYPGYEDSRTWAKENALRALHTDAVGNAIWAGATAMSKRLGGREGPSAKLVIREAANASVNDAALFTLSLAKAERAEGAAAKEAAEAWRARDDRGAYDATRRQLYQHYTWRATDEALDIAQKFKEYVRSFEGTARRQRTARGGEHFLDAIDLLSNKLGLRTDEAARPTSEIAKALAQDGFAGIAERFVQTAEKLGGDWQSLTVGQLKDAQDLIEGLHDLGKTFGDLIVKGKKRDFEKTVVGVAEHIAETRPPRPPSPNENLTQMEWLAQVRREGDWHKRKIEFMVRTLDGGKTAGKLHELLFQPVVDAEVAEHALARNLLDDLYKDFQILNHGERWARDKWVTFLDRNIQRRDVLSIALNLRNQGNEERLLGSTGWQRDAVLARLDQLLEDKDIALVNKIGKLAGSQWDEVKRVYKLANGVEPKEVTGRPVELPSGRVIDGGYYPIIKKRNARPGATEDLFEPIYEAPSVGHGFTEERAAKNVDPLELSIDALPHQLSKVAHYTTHYEAVRNIDRITKDPRVQAAIVNGLSQEAYDQIHPWLKALARDSSSGDEALSRADKVLRHLRVGSSIALLFGKTSVATKQLLGLTMTAKEIGPKYTAYGARKALGDISTWLKGEGPNPLEATTQIDPSFELMHENYDREIRDVYKGLTSSMGELRAVRHEAVTMGMAMFNLFQGTVNKITWEGAYQKALDENHPRPIDYASSVVRMAQSSGGIKDLSALQRGSESKKMWTVMHTFYNLLYNQMHEETPAGATTKEQVAIHAARWWWMILLPAALEGALAGELLNKDSDPEDRVKKLGMRAALYFAHTNPYTDQAVSAALEGRDGRIAPWVGTMYSAAKTAGKAARGEEWNPTDVTAATQAIGTVTHLPLPAALNSYRYLDKLLNGEMTEPVQNFLFRSPREAK